jgi:hypothetical protein
MSSYDGTPGERGERREARLPKSPELPKLKIESNERVPDQQEDRRHGEIGHPVIGRA